MVAHLPDALMSATEPQSAALVAANSAYLDRDRPTHVLLPVVP